MSAKVTVNSETPVFNPKHGECYSNKGQTYMLHRFGEVWTLFNLCGIGQWVLGKKTAKGAFAGSFNEFKRVHSVTIEK